MVVPKFALVSHVLPPSSSGQAIVLHRLIGGLPIGTYCLISRDRYDDAGTRPTYSPKLSGKYYHLQHAWRVPGIRPFKSTVLYQSMNGRIAIRNRAAQIGEIVEKERCDLLIACTGDLYDLPAAVKASERAGIPLISYIFDDYAYQWTGVHRTLSRRWEPGILRHSRHVIVPNEHLRDEYRRRYGIQCAVLRNPAQLPDLQALDAGDTVFGEDEIAIVYAGAVYHAHHDAFQNLVAAIGSLGRTNVNLHLFTAQPESELASAGICGPSVICHPHVDPAGLPIILRQASILFLPLAFDTAIPEVIRTSAPGKAGDYLSVGRPVLVHAPGDSFVSAYFRRNRCGAVVDRNDVRLLSKELQTLITDEKYRRDLGERAREMAEKDFDLEKIRPHFLALLNDAGLSPDKADS